MIQDSFFPIHCSSHVHDSHLCMLSTLRGYYTTGMVPSSSAEEGVSGQEGLSHRREDRREPFNQLSLCQWWLPVHCSFWLQGSLLGHKGTHWRAEGIAQWSLALSFKGWFAIKVRWSKIWLHPSSPCVKHLHQHRPLHEGTSNLVPSHCQIFFSFKIHENHLYCGSADSSLQVHRIKVAGSTH